MRRRAAESMRGRELRSGWRSSGGTRRSRWALLAIGLILPGSLPLVAQELPEGPAAPLAILEPEEVTPRGAMIRSLFVPGWGHVASEAWGRGGFYVAAQGGSLWMWWQSLQRKREAEAFAREERNLARLRYQASGVVDADSLRIRVEADPAVQRRETLVDRRGGQVEDWVALTLFLTLLGAADAYVSAHLREYPEPLALRVVPLAPGEGVEVGLRIPIGGRPSTARGGAVPPGR